MSHGFMTATEPTMKICGRGNKGRKPRVLPIEQRKSGGKENPTESDSFEEGGDSASLVSVMHNPSTIL
jgi:hypothetical protein